MSDLVVSLASEVLRPLCSACLACLAPLLGELKENVSSCLHLNRNLRSLEKQLKGLKATADEIKKKVEEEEAQLRICNPDVRKWLDKVEAMLQPSPTMEEGKDSTSCCTSCLCGCNTALLHRCQFAKEVNRKLKKVKKLKIKGDSFEPPFTQLQPPNPVDDLPNPKPTFGMESVLNQLWSHLDDKEKSIIGIYGLGGVGKTTLLKKFNNELKEKSRGYQVVIMIEVANSETLNVVDMQKTIANRLGLLWNQSEGEKERAAFLLRALRRKKFVVLLDDVWEKFQLEDVGIPTPNSNNGCKLIVASRSENVCAQMGSKNMIEMRCLDKEKSLELFLNNLTEEVRAAIDRDKDIKESAMEILDSCGGLPLALLVIGCALSCSREPQEWKFAAEAMKQKAWKIEGVDEMLKILKYSYDKLNDTQQKCFLYCTLFPEYGSINKELLVEYWVTEGLVSGEPYDGYPIIRKLVSACLLQSSDTEPSEVKMHQMIRKMGLQQASEQEIFVKAGQALKQTPDVAEWAGKTRISLMSNDIKDLTISPNCEGLETLLLQNNPNLHRLGPKFFRSMSSLKVLDLSHTTIDKLPDCSALVQLVYLNLSHTPIKELPKQLCSALVQLLYLNMSHTRITDLPKHLWKLEKLTHLNLSETSALGVIPHGTISRLFKLRVLNLYKSHYGIKELPDLNLERLEDLEFLGITIYSQAVLGKLKKSDPLARSTHCLSLCQCQDMESIQLSEFKKMKHLNELHIDSCNELKDLIVDHVEKEDANISSKRKKLKVLTLAFLPNLDTVSVGSAPHRFQDLRELTIQSCPKLKNISWVLQLESLERLVISQCSGLEEVVQEEGNGTSIRTNGGKQDASNSSYAHLDLMEKPNPISSEIEEVNKEGNMEEMNRIHAINGEEEAFEGGRDAFPRLRIVVLVDLIKLESICQTRGFPCLESVRVEKCPNLRKLLVGSVPRLKQICGDTDWWTRIPSEMKANLGDCFVPI